MKNLDPDAHAFRYLRILKGISVREAANHLNVPVTHVMRVEIGEAPIPEGWLREMKRTEGEPMTEVKPATDPLMGMDAQEWAREFLRIWSGRWSEVDEGLMISWFANAIMRGFDEGRRRTDSEKDAEIARLKAEATALREAIGVLTTLHPTMVMDPANPIGMAQEIHAHVTAEEARLKAEVERLSADRCHQCNGDGQILERDPAFETVTMVRTVACPYCSDVPTAHGTGRAR